MNKNTKVVLWLVAGVVFMGGLAFASVPLYRAFCNLTGFDGTAMRADKAPEVATNVIVRVRFDTNVRDAPLVFKVEKPYQDVRIGKTAMMYFTVTNTADRPVTARAVFNVLPETMGPYYRKLQCFCFDDQLLQAGESKTFPMVYFLDPEMLKNVDTRKLRDVTLSYTFFESKEAKK
ncbi:cytochrome c oxidase assembly protein ctaG [Asticcacaulis biprosthecium C19]|uniref:Cytochrome c oxidase assembly protein CtaG n=1 Tax=Asticcacaulis biprosthecium C19 TaxID=715226 RepID=F4QSZ4_9CAUL|nr:cytochrome c oxidase assembly protein [Asticcacaulis biprosthecium]EGF89864.1 cytochrome c oxidase assembly protein ctaG [Asticcacaulis biprosthecium C19]